MKIALNGYGQMGQAIERLAPERGHQIVAISTSRDRSTPIPSGTDVLIDFSHASAIDEVIDLATNSGVNLVIGTTGWGDRIAELRARSIAAGIGVVYAANFSPGALVMFALAREAASLLARFPGYHAGIEERHHMKKKDSPSGTAIRIADEVAAGPEGKRPPISSSRVGSEVGFHCLFFDSPDDLVEISHRARNRDGFARGALIAAETVKGKKGFFAFDELMALDQVAPRGDNE
ncbi:MAG TPA: dihydrodipicolinate reductase C-terminal domain-containing protein [Thermoanaerobaculia bacterium]|nr:dihydrodipicolinate reductase C-terminal domain-containing protein [Thermoanaerobaculia bacterium]